MLEWIARFRFVTAEALSSRFAISTQSINARLRRLHDAGLLAMHRSATTQPRAVFVTASGARRLGLRVRRPPRADAQRTHEFAIAELVAHLETTPSTAPPCRILTEREQRTAEANGTARYSVDVRPPRPGETRRWPDLVVESTDHRLAIEIEFTTKAPERLRRIIAGYAAATHYDEVRYLVTSTALAARIAALSERHAARTELAEMLDLRGARITVAPWPQAESAIRERIETALADPDAPYAVGRPTR